MQTGQAACGPLQPESRAGLRADDAEMWDSPDRRVFGGERKMLLVLMLRLMLLSAAGCGGSL